VHHCEAVVRETQSHADDVGIGIGIVYGSSRGLPPGARQLLSPARHAARKQGQLPAVLDARASCELDGDGRADLAVRTYRSETKDTVAVYPGARKGLVAAEPAVTFSTSDFPAG
jgi:hypothetical protein